jgi:uncharacterized membrane protein
MINLNFFKNHTNQKNLYMTMTISAIVGLIASFWQMIEKIAILTAPTEPLSCNINAIFNCSNILNVWQSSVFGFPNSLMCIVFFVIILAIGLVGWTGGTINKNLRLTLQAFTLFFIGFGFWYLWQSIFTVGAICIFCLFCYAAVLAISFTWLRINQHDLPISKNAKKFIDATVADGSDLFIWLSIALIIIGEMVWQFA